MCGSCSLHIIDLSASVKCETLRFRHVPTLLMLLWSVKGEAQLIVCDVYLLAGKTDDAKVSEKSRFSPQIPTYESKKLPSGSGSHTPTNTFGFKKTSSAATITASGAVITSGSATLGKIPKSIGFGSSHLVGKQSSVNDGYVPPSTRTTLQYRSLPRPSRSNSSMGTTRVTSRSIDASSISKGTATLPNPKRRSLARSSANQTDREKGVFSDTESLASGPLNKASGGAQCQSGRQTGGKSSGTSSPTLRRWDISFQICLSYWTCS